MHLLAPYFEPYEKQDQEQGRLRDAFAPLGIHYMPWCALNYDPLPSCDAVFWQGISTYYRRQERFHQLLKMADDRGVPSVNSTALIRWNAYKHYLRELQQNNIPILPTYWLDGFDQNAIARLCAQENISHYVIKPVISAGAYLTFRITDDAALAHAEAAYACLPSQPIMLQPFAPEILEDGEWSFLFFGGEFSHCVQKRAAAGDYRIQHTHGGHYAQTTPAPALLAQAAHVLACLPEAPIYARVDGIRRDGTLLLMEVELIEPYLYLDAAPHSTAHLADAIANALTSTTSPKLHTPPSAAAL